MSTQKAAIVLKNTWIIYSKLILKLIIGLFTTRLILDALGETDYGIFTLVAGVIGLLGILNISMEITTLRFIGNSLGSKDTSYFPKVFNTSIFIHFFLGLIVVLLLVLGGFIAFKYILDIPVQKLNDAKFVYSIMVFVTFMNIVTVPYFATIGAYENFFILSAFDLITSLLNLAIALMISYFFINKLIIYSILLGINLLLSRLMLSFYCRKNYSQTELKMSEFINFNVLKKMLSFSGWSMLGTLSFILNVQLRNIIINYFFGVRLNAANGVTNSLTGQLGQLSDSLTNAIQPLIMKTEGEGNRGGLIKITFISSKLSVLSSALFSIPVLFETQYLLALWLKSVPDYAVIFSQLLIMNLLLERFTFTITNSIQSVGKLKGLTITTLVITFLGVPLSLLLYKMDLPPETIFYVAILVSILKTFARIVIGKKNVGINAFKYFQEVILRQFLIITIAIFACLLLTVIMDSGILRLFAMLFSSSIILLVLEMNFGLNKKERRLVIDTIGVLKSKIRNYL